MLKMSKLVLRERCVDIDTIVLQEHTASIFRDEDGDMG